MAKRLDQSQIKTCLKYKPDFMRVQEATGVPWEAVCAVWYRESFRVAVPKTLGGQFQFDPPPPDNQLHFLLDHYSNLTAAQKADIVARGVNDFKAAMFLAACHGRHHCNPKITPQATDAEIKDFFWGYNGKAFGAADKSNYVMNNFDKAHENMMIRGTIPDESAPNGRRRIETTDMRPGAFTVYKQLKGELV